MLFAAGLGTRLRPFTNDRPKALVKVGDKTLLQHHIEKLKHFGFDEIIVNIHHFADLMLDYLDHHQNFGVDLIVSDERNELLETGGGLKKARWFLDDEEDFLVCNVDVVSDIDLKALFDFHKAQKALATLAVRQRESSRYLLFNAQQQLCGWKNVKTRELRPDPNLDTTDLQSLAFSGVQILNPRIFDDIHQEGKFSIIDVYLQLAAKEKIVAYNHSNDLWLDVGKPDSLKAAQELIHKLQYPNA